MTTPPLRAVVQGYNRFDDDWGPYPGPSHLRIPSPAPSLPSRASTPASAHSEGIPLRDVYTGVDLGRPLTAEDKGKARASQLPSPGASPGPIPVLVAIDAPHATYDYDETPTRTVRSCSLAMTMVGFCAMLAVPVVLIFGISAAKKA